MRSSVPKIGQTLLAPCLFSASFSAPYKEKERAVWSHVTFTLIWSRHTRLTRMSAPNCFNLFNFHMWPKIWTFWVCIGGDRAQCEINIWREEMCYVQASLAKFKIDGISVESTWKFIFEWPVNRSEGFHSLSEVSLQISLWVFRSLFFF